MQPNDEFNALRFRENPIIHPRLHPSLGSNINGPSLIRVPEWLPRPMGRYYLYFAHHRGTFIRMAHADDLHGPWTVHPPGTLQLAQTACRGHIASPDVHVDHARRQLRMYFHGAVAKNEPNHSGQGSYVATSIDGISFEASSTVLGPFYFRVFEHDGWTYAIAKDLEPEGGGRLLRSRTGFGDFEAGRRILPRQRHVAVRKQDEELSIFYSRGLDRPERILVSRMSLKGDWSSWEPSEPREVLRPVKRYEGGWRRLTTSRFGPATSKLRQLQDPAVFEEAGRLYLLYACAGERGIAVAELEFGES
jgi:hypothetical protein